MELPKAQQAKDWRGWRKLHIGVDGDGLIVAEALTENTKDDAAVLPELLGQVDGPIRRFTGDGAYDRKSVYDPIGTAGTEDVSIIVPPRRPAALSRKASGTGSQRDRRLERIAEIGRQAWQKEVRYRQQARVEGTFGRYKRTLGDHLRARGFEAQKREAAIGCVVLNRMLELGRPESYAIMARAGPWPTRVRFAGCPCNNASSRYDCYSDGSSLPRAAAPGGICTFLVLTYHNLSI